MDANCLKRTFRGCSAWWILNVLSLGGSWFSSLEQEVWEKQSWGGEGMREGGIWEGSASGSYGTFR